MHSSDDASTQTTAIVTGASSGIGRAIARRLTADGIHVGILGRDPERLEQAARETGAIAAQRGDVTDRDRLTTSLQQLRVALGRVDIVIANAGGTGHVATGDDPADAHANWQRIVDQNLTGTFLTALALAPHLTRPGGRLITLSSIAGATAGSAGALAYAAAKAGVDGLTRALAAELGPEGIAINAVAPGYIADTRFFGVDDQTERRQRFATLIPSGRVGYPDDVAALVAFLCRPEADHIRGQVLHINGGQHMAA